MPPPTVYFVQAELPDGPVKIGYTGRRVRERMAEGQTFAPQELTLLAETYGTREDEASLHRIFAPLHLRGEWFRYEGELREDRKSTRLNSSHVSESRMPSSA